MTSKIYAIIISALTMLAVIMYVVNKKWPDASERVVRISPVIFGVFDGKRMMPTHFYIDKKSNKKVIADFANSRFIYSDYEDKDAWLATNMPSLKRPHAITFHPESGMFFAVDTDNHQLISFKSLDDDSNESIARYSEVGDIQIGKRPHDIAYNPIDKKVYTVLNSGILRFGIDDKNDFKEIDFIGKRDIASGIRESDLGSDFAVGYVRSLTIVDGILYLSNSTQGNIIEIRNFLEPETWRAIFNKNQPKKYAEKGRFSDDGLIINDIEYFQGYWYASNYYAGNKSNYLSEAAISKNKLIRWKTWEDFENSNWEDLSHLVHPESITYNFTKSENKLYISMFHNGNEHGVGSGVYEIKTGYF